MSVLKLINVLLKTFLATEVSVFCERFLLQEKKKFSVPFLSHGKVGKGAGEDTELLHSNLR